MESFTPTPPHELPTRWRDGILRRRVFLIFATSLEWPTVYCGMAFLSILTLTQVGERNTATLASGRERWRHKLSSAMAFHASWESAFCPGSIRIITVNRVHPGCYLKHIHNQRRPRGMASLRLKTCGSCCGKVEELNWTPSIGCFSMLGTR